MASKKLVVFLLLYPVLFMIIFGSVFGRDNPIYFNMGILKEGNDEFTENFTSIFKDLKSIQKFEVFERGNKSVEEEAKNLIEKGFVIVIFIPKDFSKIMLSTANISIFMMHLRI